MTGYPPNLSQGDVNDWLPTFESRKHQPKIVRKKGKGRVTKKNKEYNVKPEDTFFVPFRFFSARTTYNARACLLSSFPFPL